jgi:hypothetical protein
MATKTWIGALGTDWFTDGAWNPIGTPAAGDTAVIAQGSARISSFDLLPLSDIAILLGSPQFSAAAGLASAGGTIDAGTTITLLEAAPYGTLSLLNGTTFNGTVDVKAAQLSVTVDQTLTGTGTIEVSGGGRVEVTGDGAAAPGVTFLDDNGTLFLNTPSNFAGQISGVRTGDRIELGTHFLAYGTSYANGVLTVLGAGGSVLATLDLSLAPGAPAAFYTDVFGHGGSVITTSNATHVWAGGDGGDWFDAANWSNGVPLGGDTVRILSGRAVLSAADTAAGVLDFEHLSLGGPGSVAPVTLQTTDAFFGSAFALSALGTPQYTPDYIAPQATLLAYGTTRFEGVLTVESHGGTLTVDVESDGTDAAFILAGQPGTLDQDIFAEAVVGQESRLQFVGSGTVTNNGLVQVDGSAAFGSNLTLDGAGTILIEAGGKVSIDGAVDDRQSVMFGDHTGRLTIGNLAAFDGAVTPFATAGNTIDIIGVQASTLSYAFGVLSLLDADGTSVGQLRVADPGNDGAGDFTLASDGTGGSLITYTPQGPVTLRESLPVVASGETGATIPLATLLTQSFGAVPSGYDTYRLSGPQALMPTESYWQQGPWQPTNSVWLHNGVPITEATTVAAADIGDYALLVGNNIVSTASFTVPVSQHAGVVTENVQYSVWSANPEVVAQSDGVVSPDDIVASAQLYATEYPGVLNYNNCNWIADNLTASAGATMPFDDASTDPVDNQEGGFWRIAYRGSDQPAPVADWFTLTQPGDVVRMGRLGGGGQHTTTVVGPVNPDGSLPVYDNGDTNSQGQNIIGMHNATYWTGTDPASITIYRLDPNHQYLITGTSKPEFLQGTIYNDLIRPSGGADVVTGGPGDNEVQGSVAQLDGITVTDFGQGDWLDFTDLLPGKAAVSYDAATGLLDVTAGSCSVASVKLASGLTGTFVVADDGTGGTKVSLDAASSGVCGDKAVSAASAGSVLPWSP